MLYGEYAKKCEMRDIHGELETIFEIWGEEALKEEPRSFACRVCDMSYGIQHSCVVNSTQTKAIFSWVGSH